MYWVGGSYRITPVWLLSAAVYRQHLKGASADPTLVSFRAQHALSKRTALYTAAGFAFAQHGANVSVSREAVGYANTQVGMTVGIQQRF
jgi:predicted porin